MAQLSSVDASLVKAAWAMSLGRMRRALKAGASPNVLLTSDSMPPTLSRAEDALGWWIEPGKSKTLFDLLVWRSFSEETDDAKDEQRVACLRLLVEHGGAMDAETAHTCLYIACVLARLPVVVQWLLADGGASVSFRVGAAEETALHAAVRTDVARVLLAAGADVLARNADAMTPLHTLAARSSADVPVGLFTAYVEAWADVSAPCIFGLTVLHELVYPDKHIRMDFLDELLQLGADASLCNDFGETPLGALLRFTEEDCDEWHELEDTGKAEPGNIAEVIDVLAPITAWHQRRHMLLAIRSRAH